MSAITRRLAFIAQLLPDDHIALSADSRQLTYSELIDAVEQCGQWLKGLANQNGESLVALHAENSIDWVIVDLACQEAGLPCVPLPAFFSPEQIQQCLLSSAADIVISDNPSFLEQLKLTETGAVKKGLCFIFLSPFVLLLKFR